MNSLNDLNHIKQNESITIRWLKMPEDYEIFCEHLRERYPDRVYSIEDILNWEKEGATYCGLLKNGIMIACAAVEKYHEDKWETGCVRVWKAERGNGYAKQICYFVTKFILEHDKIATCRTEEDNISMQKVINSLGFQKVGYVK